MSDIADSVIDRIKKLLRLAERAGSEHEAANAATRAQELMAAHRINLAEIEIHGGESAAAEPVGKFDLGQTGKGRNRQHWQGYLAHHVAKSMGCGCYWHGNNLIIVGRTTTAEGARAMFHYLVVEIERLAAKSWADDGQYSGTAAKSWRDGFRKGAVSVIGRRLAEQTAAQESALREQERAAPTGCTALMIIKRDETEVRSFMINEGIRGKARGNGASNGDAFRAGREAGRSVHLGKNLGAGGQRLLS